MFLQSNNSFIDGISLMHRNEKNNTKRMRTNVDYSFTLKVLMTQGTSALNLDFDIRYILIFNSVN